MKSFLSFIFVSCVGFTMLFTGCSVHNPIDVQIAPEINATTTLEGDSNPTILLTVVDERPTNKIGMRGAANMGGEITPKGNVAELIKSAIQSGLEEERFIISSSGQGSDLSDLTVEVRDINYEIIAGVWSGTAKSESAMKGICTPKNGKQYKKLYRGVHEVKGLQLVPDENGIRDIISKAVSDNINDLINDRDMVTCLAE